MLTETQIARLYVATFNRAPDAAGLAYWISDGTSNTTSLTDINDIARAMQAGAEASSGVSSMSDSDYVISLYSSMFCRSVSSTDAGVLYWVGEMGDGSVDRANLIQTLILGAEASTGSVTDAAVLANKTTVGLAFANAGLNDVDLAQTVLLSIDSTQTSVNDALSLIDQMGDPLHTEAMSHSVNDSGVGPLSTFETYGVEALNSGYTWDYPVVTYSFNTSIPSWYYTHTDASTITPGWTPLNTSMKNAVIQISSELNQLIGIELQQVDNYGMIRYNIVDMPWGGFAYYPMQINEVDGDVFLTTDFLNQPDLYSVEAGGNGWMTIAHELGHALGLKHPFEEGSVLPTSLDNTSHTIMSYTDYNHYTVDLSITSAGLSVDYLPVNPALYSVYDIAALQALYGPNLSTRTTDDTYSVNFDVPTYLTIWDAGGEDTIDLSNATGYCSISLISGSLNAADVHTFSEQIADAQAQAHAQGYYNSDAFLSNAYNDIADSLFTGENDLAIAVGAIIENLTTGSGNDTVWDNEVDNSINTGAGNDTLYLGHGGWDSVDGGTGQDTLYVDSSFQSSQIARLNNNEWRIIGNDFAVDLVGIETVVFSDMVSRSIETLG